MWPGFGENARVLDWVLQRISGHECYTESAIGRIPTAEGLRTDGLTNFNMEEIFEIPKDFWTEEVKAIETYFENQVGSDLPEEIKIELGNLKKRIENL